MKEADDFLAESASLKAVLATLPDDAFDATTQFKDWSINDVLQHLHTWNQAALFSAQDEAQFEEMLAARRAAPSLRAFERSWTSDVRGSVLRELWWHGVAAAASTFAALDPRLRLKWVGPSMSARSSITARQMETWAHGQEVFDVLGKQRIDAERLRNIAHLGVSTFGWTFAVRGRAAPAPAPSVELVAPDGALWTWNELSEIDRVSGSATEFCQVVTQTRNIADTTLVVKGTTAHEWMAIAQCFAGAASDPPAPGTRFLRHGR